MFLVAHFRLEGLQFSGTFWIGLPPLCGPLAMSGVTVAAPPAQVSLRVAFDPDEPPMIERIVRWFGLETQLTADPTKMLLPLQLSKTEEIIPGPTTYEDFRIDWCQHFNEDYDYMVFIPEPLYTSIAIHCSLAFPSQIVQCGGPGRVTTCELIVKPVSAIDLTVSLNELDRRLSDTRRELRQVLRRMDMLESNLGVSIRSTLTIRPDLVSQLHGETPASWYSGLTEEF